MARTPARPNSLRIKKLQRSVLEFYRTRRRDLPWRRTRDPYRILVSEIMLQQTQVDRVIPKYREFLAAFPSIRALAKARFARVLRVWLGLGYNSRALRLWQCARSVVRDRSGRLPRDLRELQQLPGLGLYTASALLSFAFGAQVPVVDTNVRRVLVRTLTGRDHASPARVAALARAALPRGQSSQWAQGLMDVGALFCKSTPKCALCPARLCCAYALGGSIKRTSPHSPTPFIGSNRFYRGRIMRELCSRRSANLAAIGRQVKEDFEARDAAWLDDILQSLQRDGLVLIDRSRQRVRLA